MNRRSPFRLCGPFVLFFALLFAGVPAKADTWLYRPLTVPSGTAAVDFGFALGHHGGPAPRTGPGMNLEVAFGVASNFDLGIRTGFRFGVGGRQTRADEYARQFETETYGSLGDRGAFASEALANPEIRLRWALARGPVLHLAFEGRFFLPIEDQSRFGVMPAIPISFRLGSVRLDTGVYVPIVFSEPDTTTVISVPIALWIQASNRLFLGPDAGVRVWDNGATFKTYPFGFGLGYALGASTDLRTRVFFRDVGNSAAARDFGFGIAFQFRT